MVGPPLNAGTALSVGAPLNARFCVFFFLSCLLILRKIPAVIATNIKIYWIFAIILEFSSELKDYSKYKII